MVLLYVVAYPISRVLDMLLGAEVVKKAEDKGTNLMWMWKVKRDGADDCCAPTAVTVADDFLVASIPYGTQSGIWCNCRGSRLFGLKLPPAA